MNIKRDKELIYYVGEALIKVRKGELEYYTHVYVAMILFVDKEG